MDIPLSSLLVVLIGSVASLASLAASLTYIILQDRQQKGQRAKKITLTIGNETITMKTTPQELTKLVDTINKYQEQSAKLRQSNRKVSARVPLKRVRPRTAIQTPNPKKEPAVLEKPALE